MNNSSHASTHQQFSWESMMQACFYTFLLGIITSTASIGICIGIIKSKKLRSRFFAIIGFLTLCRAMLALQYFFVGVYRILKNLSLIETSMTRLACHTLHFWIMCGSTLEMFLLLILVLDRAVAIVTPIYYRLLKPSQAVFLCIGISILVCTSTLAYSYSNVDLMGKIVCSSSYSPTSESFNNFTQTIDFVIVILILIAYVILILCIRWKMKKSDHIDTNSAAHVQLQRQLKLVPMLRNLVLSHCGLSLVARLMFFLVSVAPQISKLGLYGGILVAIDEFINVLVLLHMNKDLRTASLPACCAKLGPKNQVTTVRVTKMNAGVSTTNM